MRRFRHQRKPLIKMKNGRHRVATTIEAELREEAARAKLSHLNASSIANRLRGRIDAMLVEGVTGALPAELRQRAIDQIADNISSGWGEEMGRAFCKAANRDYDQGFVMDAMVRRRYRPFNLAAAPVPEKVILMRTRMSGFEWNVELEVPLR